MSEPIKMFPINARANRRYKGLPKPPPPKKMGSPLGGAGLATHPLYPHLQDCFELINLILEVDRVFLEELRRNGRIFVRFQMTVELP